MSGEEFAGKLENVWDERNEQDNEGAEEKPR